VGGNQCTNIIHILPRAAYLGLGKHKKKNALHVSKYRLVLHVKPLIRAKIQMGIRECK